MTKWLLVLWLPSIAASQTQCRMVYLLDRYFVDFRTLSARGGSSAQACGETTTEGDVIRRVFYDTSGKEYFGYEIRITSAGDRQFRAEMGPLKQPGLRSFSKFPPPVQASAFEYIEIPVLERRETSTPQADYWSVLWARTLDYWRALAMLVHLPVPATRPPLAAGRVTDYLRIERKGTVWASAGIPDFHSWPNTLPPETNLTLDQPHLTNYMGDLGRNPDAGVIGPVVWLYREGLGRFLFSASPRPGFRKTGLVEGALLQFNYERGGKVFGYKVGLHSNAVPMPGAWMIWMKDEPEYRRPPGPWSKEELRKGMLAIGVER
jgi:hypothetical protein